MPIIQIQMLMGRDIDQKRAMIRDMTEAFTRNCGGHASEVNIVISEVEYTDWASGGVLCSDANHQPASNGGCADQAERF